MARPMATRWRWPPDSALGLREVFVELQDLGGLGDAEAISALGSPGHLQAEAHVLRDRHVRVERVGLEHHRTPRSPGRAGSRPPADATSPSVVSSSPAIMRSSVDLPQPEGPTSTQNSPSSMSR
jgi:hypothetical protein